MKEKNAGKKQYYEGGKPYLKVDITAGPTVGQKELEQPVDSGNPAGTQEHVEFWMACEKAKVWEYEVVLMKEMKTVVGKEEKEQKVGLKNMKQTVNQ